MEESIMPSISAGVVGSRFVTQEEVETVKARRDEQWKAAYARLGQEPPPQQQEDSYDGRSLAEKLAANRVAKQEEWEEKTKLANQFRALEEDEIMFLDSIRERQEEEERQRREKDGEEVKNFKEAVAARIEAVSQPPPIISSDTTVTPASIKPKPAPARKDAKRGLKGVVVKKKPKPVVSQSVSSEGGSKVEVGTDKDDDAPPNQKRRKIGGS
ncbi:N-terminal domain of NEFA-interacting nuclear protein NIP30-domain-containing protein [Crassisporium funariophilum]|nr:N-terminal domain of NEFA-interacting nuclear protein NIP30-domain-containing protein [Crassisporium funariophilum]